MRFSTWLLVALLVGVAVHTRADETGDFIAAQKALDAAPAFRATVTAMSSMVPGMNRATFEFLSPDLVHAKAEFNGTLAYEAYTDGKKIVVSEQGGAYKDAPAALAGQITRARGDMAIRAENSHDFTHKVRLLTFSGHETVNGVVSSCYKGEDDDAGFGSMTAMHNSVKIWISDQDHRPVRVEWDMHGTQKTDPHDAGQPFNQEVQVNYDYDQTIKFSVPVVE